MLKTIIIMVSSLLLGILVGYYLLFFTQLRFSLYNIFPTLITKKQIIGFLPYWLLDKAQPNYSTNITNLTYFGLVINPNGTILKLNTPTEEHPGWAALTSGKLDVFLQKAKKHNIKLSLLLDSGDTEAIDALVASPISHAKRLVTEVTPLIKTYGFSDLNLDIEYTQSASSEARIHFTQFVQEVKKELKTKTT